MVFQTLYFLIDLYWVGRLGTEAVAAGGHRRQSELPRARALQMLGVGTTDRRVARRRRKDHAQASLLFNQSQVLAMVTGAGFLVVGLALRSRYSRRMGADAVTARLADEYLLWFIPAMALSSRSWPWARALRATGNFKPGDGGLDGDGHHQHGARAFLIFGWGTGRPMGVAGAAVSSLVAIAIGIVWLTTYFINEGCVPAFRLRCVVAAVTTWAANARHRTPVPASSSA
jgi:Na+-driven multidrug efflux pump